MESKKKGLIVLIVILAILAIVAIFALLSPKTSTKKSDSYSEDFGGFSSLIFGDKSSGRKNKDFPYIAVIHIEGVIEKAGNSYNQEWLMDTIDELENDFDNHGILLYIDSPGGTVYEADETYLKLLEYKEKTNCPVYAYFGSLAASGGYYIASAADYIFANRNTLTGSIGVIAGQSFDATELLEKIGVKSRTFTAGKNKNMLNFNQPLTDEQEQIMQSIADDAYEQFTSIVAESRKMSIDDVKKLADGRIYTANQALKNGLIDKICSLEEAKEIIEKDSKLDYDFEFEDFTYEYEMSIKDLFKSVSSFVKSPSAVFSKMNEMRLNYLAY